MSSGNHGTADADPWPPSGADLVSSPPHDLVPALAKPDVRTQAVLGLRVAAALVLGGGLIGLVWRFVAPVAQVRIESTGGYFVDPEQYVAADAWFAGLCLVAGVVAGLVAWRLLRRVPLAAVLGLAGGGIVGAFIAREVGQLLGHVDGNAAVRLPVGTVTGVSLQLQASAALVVLPVAAVGTWLVLDLVADARAGRAARAGSSPDPGWGRDLSPDDPPGPPPPTSA
jgi:hypothetical protein